MEQKETEEFFYLKVVKHGLEYRLIPMGEDHFEGVVVGKAKIYKDDPKANNISKLYDTNRFVIGL
jgi:hypothetical protein